jgi:hypothetical protein
MQQLPNTSPGLAQPVGASIKHACGLLGMTRSRLYLELAAGNIRAWKHGKRTIIDMESARSFLASLPKASFRASATSATAGVAQKTKVV